MIDCKNDMQALVNYKLTLEIFICPKNYPGGIKCL